MGQRQSFISAVLGELSRRKVLRSVGAYAVAVFVVLQLMDAAVEPLRLPDWFPTLVVVVLILGFPLVFMLAWYFDITGHGFRRTRSASLLGRRQTFALFATMFVITGALGVGMYRYYSGVFEADASMARLAGDAAPRDFRAPENSIAVLPFADHSESGDQVYLSDGMAEEILNLLTKVDGLHVAARTSSFAFRNASQGIRDIGRTLNVRTVLEGSIRKVGDRIRLTAQLINAEDEFLIWSNSYDREVDDVFALQDEVASAIAGELVDSFAGLSANPAERAANLAAFEAYRTGRLHWWRRSPAELQQAIELFADALQDDPNFAPAYAALADSWILLSMYGDFDRIRAIERAIPMIDKALAIDPESAEAYAALGLARSEIDQLDSAESALRQAVKLDEDYMPAKLWLANLLGAQGRLPEEGVVLQEAMALDPLNDLLVINYANNLNRRGQYVEARQLIEDLLRIKPDSATLLRTLSGLAIDRGELVAGWEHARRGYDLDTENPTMIQALARVWLVLGDTARAEKLLLAALALAGENMALKMEYLMVLLVDGRLETAEGLVRETFSNDIEALPGNFQRLHHYQMGLIRAVDRDAASALDEFEQAVNPDADQLVDGDEMFVLTMAAYFNDHIGNDTRAAEHLAQAERAIQRARVNGVDDPITHYNEAIVALIRHNESAALEALQQAYARGWRQAWIMQIDGRLDPLRDHPGFVALSQKIDDDIAQARETVREQAVAMF